MNNYIKGENYNFLDRSYSNMVDASVDSEKLAKRVKKWKKMIESMHYWKEGIRRLKLKSRCWKGIPEEIRKYAWLELASIKASQLAYPSLFSEIRRNDCVKYDEQIRLDLNRTFPKSKQFEIGQLTNLNNLFITLRCCSIYLDNDGGYCQAMAPIVGYLLFRFSPNESFLIFCSLYLEHFKYYFSPGLDEFKTDCLYLELLIEKNLPKFHILMNKLDMNPCLFSAEWLMCGYVRCLSLDLVDHIWDILLLEGRSILFKVALSIISVSFPEKILPFSNFDLSHVFISLLNLPKDTVFSMKILAQCRCFYFDHAEYRKFKLEKLEEMKSNL